MTDDYSITMPYRIDKFTARNDYAFKKLFGTEENKDIMSRFVSLATGINEADFKDVKIANNELSSQFYKDKTGRLDIKIILKDGKKINVEMQNTYFHYYPKRSIFYWAELFIENFKKSDEYYSLNKCIGINILNAPFPLKDKMHSIYKILETEDYSPLDDVLEIHFLDLTRLTGSEITEFEKWLLFIRTDDSNIRRQLAEENPMIAKANEVMNIFYLSDEERQAYLAASHYESDRASMLGESKREGIAEGMLKGMAKGMAKGRAKGREEGRAEGFYDAKVETAKRLLEMGLALPDIVKATTLSESEIKKL